MPKKITIDSSSGGDTSTTLEFDTKGRVTKKTDAEYNVSTFAYLSSNSFDNTFTDANGNKRDMAFDVKGRLKSITRNDDDWSTTFYTYTAGDKIKSVTYGDGTTGSNYHYDAAQRLIGVIDSTGKSASYEYDLLNNMETVKIGYGLTGCASGSCSPTQLSYISSDIRYDEFGLVKSSDGQNGQGVNLQYNSKKQLESETDALGRVTSYQYNGFGQLTSVTNTAEETTDFLYDSLGYLREVKDALGRKTNYQRNGYGEVTKVISPSTGSVTQSYNKVGLPFERTDAKGVKTILYDRLGRMTSFTYGSGNLAALFYYDEDTPSASLCNNGKGKLCGFSDTSGVSVNRTTLA